MPRENSFSDSEGRSLTPDLDEDRGFAPASPTYTQFPRSEPQGPSPTSEYPPRARVSTNASRPRVIHPRDKFRSAVRKVIAMHRSTSMIANRGVGAEPGIDPRRSTADLEFGHVQSDCVIQVFDYSSVRSSIGTMTNKEFVDLMNDPLASEPEPWVKVRWINIGGLSWDVIKAVSIKYNLHPLALEDIFHTRSQTRSKADYYPKHLFLRILCHELGVPVPLGGNPFTSAAAASTLTDVDQRSSSPLPFTENDLKGEHGDLDEDGMDGKTVYGSMPSRKVLSTRRRRGPLLPRNQGDLKTTAIPLHTRRHKAMTSSSTLVDDSLDPRQKRRLEEAALERLKENADKVDVRVTPMFIFLLRDGTVISIHQTPNLEFTKPITSRLFARDTGLRTSADPSMLVQSLLDLIVDRALEVIDEYHAKIVKFEREILIKPDVATIRNLHILSEDLILHKRTLEPIKTVVYGLRRYDLDRCMAIVDPTDPEAAKRVVGFMSHKSKIYLADVHDHMEYILSSLDMFANIGENLVDYTFNMKSYEMNEIMRTLTLVTIIALPLTFLTGYFGMNFEVFWGVQQGHSDVLFWIIAVPVLAVVIPLCLVADIRHAIFNVKKRLLAKKAVEGVKRD